MKHSETYLAQEGYKAYGEFTDNKNFRGEEMPSWEKLPEKIQGAWKHTVGKIYLLCSRSHYTHPLDMAEAAYNAYREAATEFANSSMAKFSDYFMVLPPAWKDTPLHVRDLWVKTALAVIAPLPPSAFRKAPPTITELEEILAGPPCTIRKHEDGTITTLLSPPAITEETQQKWKEKEVEYEGDYAKYADWEKALGKVAYMANLETYLARTGFVGRDIWESLPPDIRCDWVETARAVASVAGSPLPVRASKEDNVLPTKFAVRTYGHGGPGGSNLQPEMHLVPSDIQVLPRDPPGEKLTFIPPPMKIGPGVGNPRGVEMLELHTEEEKAAYAKGEEQGTALVAGLVGMATRAQQPYSFDDYGRCPLCGSKEHPRNSAGDKDFAFFVHTDDCMFKIAKDMVAGGMHFP